MHDRRAQILRVIDGDSLVAMIEQDYGDFKRIEVRLGADYAPEEDDPGGPETTAFAEQWVANHDDHSEWPFLWYPKRTRADTHEIKSFDRFVGRIEAKDGDCINDDVQKFVHENGYGPGITVPAEKER